jgi:type IV pilus assembly protein PilO
MKLSDPIKLPTAAFNLLNLHIAGVGLLVMLNIFLLVKLGLAWRDLGSSRQQQLQQEQLTLAQLEAQNAKLNGLPEKVDLSRKQAEKFYTDRIPAHDSSMIGELGNLVSTSKVRLTRASYTATPALEGLDEVRIDANLAGDYSGMMHFINGVERDKTFFVISALTLTGQQGGLVNLRLRLTTYLNAADASKLPAAPPDDDNATPPAEQSGVRPVSAVRPVAEPVSQEAQ